MSDPKQTEPVVIDRSTFSTLFEKHGRYLKNPKSGAKLQLFGATVKGVQATEVELHGASFVQVTFQNCSFWRTDFTEASFE